MEFRILGPLEVLDGEREVPVAGARARRLLTALALAPGEAQPAERLVELVWPAERPRHAANALQVQVSKLRRGLGDGVITTRGRAYQLDVERTRVDAHRFEEEVRHGTELLRAGRFEEAAAPLRAALRRWRGAALADLDHPDLDAEVHRLDELRLVALEHRVEVDLALGLHEAVAAELDGLLERHPLRERLWGLQMVALYRAGRQAEAVRTYQSARRRLGEELGLEPPPELVALEGAILANDPALRRPEGPAAVAVPYDPTPRPGVPVRNGDEGRTTPGPADPGGGRGRRGGNLPADLTRFVGRERELAQVVDLVPRHRLVTLVGPGGVGKTRLLLAAARHLSAGPPSSAIEAAVAVSDPAPDAGPGELGADGVWFVGLAALHDEAGVAPRVAATIGAAELWDASNQRTVAAWAATERLAAFVGDRRLLVLLDNCEHVVAEVARLVDALLQACPNLHVATTSREGLGVPGEVLWPVPSLDLHEAVQLFGERAAGLAPGVDVVAEQATVAEICRRLDGLPLAIELAAARARVLPLGEIATRLDDRFRLLTGGSRSALPRQQTLRAVVDWSYDLLAPEEQQAFWRLSVFAGGCELAAAAEVLAQRPTAGADGGAGDGSADQLVAADLLGRLVDKSLVMALRPSGGGVRYRLLQTLWFYGREKLAASGEADEVRHRHLAWCRALAEAARDELYGSGQVRWMAVLRAEVENLRAAVDWAVAIGDRRSALAIADACAWFWWLTGDLAEARTWLEAALGIVEPAPDGGEDLELRLLVTRCRAWLGWCTAHVAGTGGLEDVLAAQDDAHHLGDPYTLGMTCLLAANIAAYRGDRQLAESLAREGDAAMSAAGDGWGMGVAAVLQAIAADLAGEVEVAAGFFERATRLLTRAGDNWGLAITLSESAAQAERLGDYERAWQALRRCRRLLADLDSPTFEMTMVARLGTIALLQGRLDVAERYHEQADCAARGTGLRFARSVVMLARALSQRWTGRLAEARVTLEQVLAVLEPVEMPIAEALCRSSLGFVAEEEGRAEEAAGWHRGALACAVRGGDRRGVALAIEGLAGAEALRGDGTRAGFLLGVADGLRRATGGPLPVGERHDVDRITARGRAAVGGPVFDAAFGRGAHVPADGFVAGLLEGPDPVPCPAAVPPPEVASAVPPPEVASAVPPPEVASAVPPPEVASATRQR